jgi:hypothetical protein
MEFKEALAALEKLEGGAALAAVFSSHVNEAGREDLHHDRRITHQGREGIKP